MPQPSMPGRMDEIFGFPCQSERQSQATICEHMNVEEGGTALSSECVTPCDTSCAAVRKGAVAGFTSLFHASFTTICIPQCRPANCS